MLFGKRCIPQIDEPQRTACLIASWVKLLRKSVLSSISPQSASTYTLHSKHSRDGDMLKKFPDANARVFRSLDDGAVKHSKSSPDLVSR